MEYRRAWSPRLGDWSLMSSFWRPPSPEALLRASRACWIPPGTSTSVRGFDLAGGMIYVGSRLPTAVRWPDRSPALIDPQLPVGRSRSGLSLGRSPDRADAVVMAFAEPTKRLAAATWGR